MKKRKFIKAYKEFHEPIYRFIYFKVSSKETAQDLAGDVFLKSWKFAQKNKIENLRAFLYHIARNLVIDYYKKQKPVALEKDIAQEQKSKLDLEIALKKLTSNEKDAFILHYLEGFSYQEIGQIINKNSNTVRVLAMKAKNKIHKQIKP